MSKQELMDKAINEANGLWCSKHPLLFVSGELNVIYPKHTKFICDRKGAASNGFWDLVCTVDEYTQRAKELGWLNGYKFGVEYETNGKKPDLPNDVLVEVKVVRNEWGSAIPAGLIEFDETDLSAAAFRIVDQRYKPVSENQEKQQNVSVLSESKSKDENVIADNSWYDIYDLPPIGTFVDVVGEVRYGAGESNCEVVAHVENCAVIRMSWGLGCFESHALSPSKSEREKFIEAVLGVSCMFTDYHAQLLYDADFSAPLNR